MTSTADDKKINSVAVGAAPLTAGHKDEALAFERLEVRLNRAGRTTIGPVGRDGNIVPWVPNAKHAAFIVQACNSHHAMKEALEGLVPFLDDLDDATVGVGVYPEVACTQRCREAVANARAALRLGKEI